MTEKQNNQHQGANGESRFYNVFRRFIPDAAGISLNKTWNKGESYTLTEKTWVIEKIPLSADIEVVAFIQNNITKEIYQATSNIKHNIITGTDNLSDNSGKRFALYPNPAVNRLTISFDNILEVDTDIRIYDFTGTVVRTFKTGPAQSEYSIDNLDLKNGIYLVRISSGNQDYGFKKLVISGR